MNQLMYEFLNGWIGYYHHSHMNSNHTMHNFCVPSSAVQTGNRAAPVRQQSADSSPEAQQTADRKETTTAG